MTSELTIPLFPLSAHVLPGGYMSLRIFEPRYVRMVKEACASDNGFGICMFNAKGEKEGNQHIFPIGTFVKVVDFDVLEDGLLGIKVKGDFCFEVKDVYAESDGLLMGICEPAPMPQCATAANDVSHLTEKLQQIFERYPEIKALYPKPQFSSPLWVMYRWMEILPIPAQQKQALLKEQNSQPIEVFLNEIIK